MRPLTQQIESLKVRCPCCEASHEIEMEAVSCIACGADQAEIQFYRGDLWLDLGGQFAIVQCRQCDLIYLNPRPRPEAIGYYYPAHYLLYKMPHLDDDLPFLVRWEETRRLNKKLRLISAYKKSGRLLDIGCATGIFLNHMQTSGSWQVYGLDLSPNAVAEARQRYGLNVWAGDFQAMPIRSISETKFDVITFWDVLEHLHNPVEALEQASDLLEPDGIIVLRIPTADSLGAKVFGRYWIGYEIPRHLYVFNRQTIKQILARAGLQMVDEYVLYGSDFTFVESLRFFLKGRGRSPLLYNGLCRLLYSWPARWLLWPFFKILDYAKATTMMTLVAGKVN